jgi:hypothetical protein
MDSLAQPRWRTRRPRADGEGSPFDSATHGWCAGNMNLNGRRITRESPLQTKSGAERLLRQKLRDRMTGPVAWPCDGASR